MSKLSNSSRPTLKTLAELTGLAVPTVSRALNNAPDIGQKTKLRVREAAEKIGYKPNRAGLRLRTGKTQVISLVLSTSHEEMSQTAMLIGAIARGFRETSYHMIVTPYFPDDDLLTPIKYIVESGSADGIILNQTRPDDPRIDYLSEINFPFVTHGRSNRCSEHGYYDFEHHDFGRLAIEKLVTLERKNVLIIAPPLEHNYTQDFLRGATLATQQSDIKLTRLKQADSDNSLAELESALAHQCHLDNNTQEPTRTKTELPTQKLKHCPYDAFICSSTAASLAVIALADELGLKIGTDIDLLTREPFPCLSRFRPGIHHVSEDLSQAGLFLSKAILQAINSPNEPPLQGVEKPQQFQKSM